MTKERTLVLIKPDAIARGLIGAIIQRLEKTGLKIIAMKMIRPTKELAQKHYPVTEEWYKKVGTNTLDDTEKYGLDAEKTMGTSDPVAIGHKIHDWNVEFLTSSPVVAMIFEGIHAIEGARRIAGATVPNLAQIGTIRGDYGTGSALSSNSKSRTIYNLMHTSKNAEEAIYEIDLWFGDEAPHEYSRGDENYL